MWRPPQTGAAAMAADANDSEEAPLTLGNQYPLTHAILFVLGVLPQAIKLFGMHGPRFWYLRILARWRGVREATMGRGSTGREDDGDVEARGNGGASGGMGLVCRGAVSSGPQFLRVICLRSRLDVPDEWGDMDRACHLMELAALVRSYKEVCDLAACLLYFGLAVSALASE